MIQTLYIMTGFPYSGKTTLANELVKRFGFKTASVDDAMNELKMHEDTMSQADWNTVYSKAYDDLIEKLKNGYSVIFDMGHLKFSERESSRNVAISQRVVHKLIYVNTRMEEITKRREINASTKERGQLSDRGMKEALSQFQPPTSSENPIIYNQTMDLETWIKENIT